MPFDDKDGVNATNQTIDVLLMKDKGRKIGDTSHGRVEYTGNSEEDSKRMNHNVRINKIFKTFYDKFWKEGHSMLEKTNHDLYRFFEEMERRQLWLKRNILWEASYAWQNVAIALIKHDVVWIDFQTKDSKKEDLDNLFKYGTALVKSENEIQNNIRLWKKLVEKINLQKSL